MPVQLPVPAVSYKEVELSLSGITYNFVFRFNDRMIKYEGDEGTWIIDIFNSSGSPIVRGLAVVGQGFLIDRLILPEFSNGDILCFRAKKTDKAPTRNNLGIDKDYWLVYMTNEEIEDALL